MYPRSGGASCSKDDIARSRAYNARRSPEGMDLEDQVEVITDANGAPRVQVEYETWLQMKEYLDTIYKYVEHDFATRFLKARSAQNRKQRRQKQGNEGTEEAEPKAKKAKPGDKLGVTDK